MSVAVIGVLAAGTAGMTAACSSSGSGADEPPALTEATTSAAPVVTTSSPGTTTTVTPAPASTTSSLSPVASTTIPGVPSPGAQTLHETFVDESRRTSSAGGTGGAPDRTLETTIYLPRFDGDAAPLIVLAHGFDGHPRKFTDLATAWADAGFVVAVPKFPLTNDEVPSPQISDLAEQHRDVDVVIDSMLVLSRSPRGPVSGRIDTARIGLYGLSLGSLTVWGTLLDGCCDAGRVDAVVQSDGAFPLAPERLADIRRPVMLVHSDVDGIFPYDRLRAQYDALPAPKYLLTTFGTVHAAVGENTPTPADEAYRQATITFWERHLAGRPGTPFPDTVTIDGVTRLESVTR